MRIFNGPHEYEVVRRRVVEIATYVLVVLGIVSTIVLLVPAWGEWNNRILAKVLLVLCGLVPPAWFWFEYEVIWIKAPTDRRPIFEHFKYGQDLSRNVWLAFGAILLAIYFK